MFRELEVQLDIHRWMMLLHVLSFVSFCSPLVIAVKSLDNSMDWHPITPQGYRHIVNSLVYIIVIEKVKSYLEQYSVLVIVLDVSKVLLILDHALLCSCNSFVRQWVPQDTFQLQLQSLYSLLSYFLPQKNALPGVPGWLVNLGQSRILSEQDSTVLIQEWTPHERYQEMPQSYATYNREADEGNYTFDSHCSSFQLALLPEVRRSGRYNPDTFYTSRSTSENLRPNYDANLNMPPPYNRAVMDEVFVSNGNKQSSTSKYNPRQLCRSLMNAVKTNKREKSRRRSS